MKLVKNNFLHKKVFLLLNIIYEAYLFSTKVYVMLFYDANATDRR